MLKRTCLGGRFVKREQGLTGLLKSENVGGHAVPPDRFPENTITFDSLNLHSFSVVHCLGPSPCPISLNASFLLNTAANYRDFNKQKTFLKLTAAKFIVANGNRLSVSVYRDTTLHRITLTASKDNKDFANRVDKLYLFNGECRLDLALNSVLDKYYRPGQASLKAKVIVLVVGHKLVRSPDLCESYIQPYELASKLKVAGVRVIMAVIGVNASEFSKEIVDSDDEVWYFANYDELVSSARDFSVAICRTAGNLKPFKEKNERANK